MIARVASIVALLAMSLWLHARGLDARGLEAEEQLLVSQSVALAMSGHDADRHWLPLFVHAAGEVWLAPVPVYLAAAMTKLSSSDMRVRWVAAFMGTLDVLLVYLIADRMFHSNALALVAALMLLSSPAHLMFSRMAVLDGVWQVPFVLVWLLALTAYLTRPPAPSRWPLIFASAALAASAYSQPAAAVMIPVFLAIGVAAITRARASRLTDWLTAAATFVAVLLPALAWFGVNPSSYADTFGRWLLHPAHVLNPIAWARAVTNWNSLSVWSDAYWSFFAPSQLLLDLSGDTVCGALLLPVGILTGIGIYDAARPRNAGDAYRVHRVILLSFVLAPLAAATFKEPRAIQRVLVMVPFGVLLATCGVHALWETRRSSVRAATVALLATVPVQFWWCYPSFSSWR